MVFRSLWHCLCSMVTKFADIIISDIFVRFLIGYRKMGLYESLSTVVFCI